MGNLGEKEKENAINEVRLLASIKHPCVSSYKEAFIDESSQSLCIVMELADDGDLYQKIQKMQQNQSFFQENDVWKILIQTVFGLKALHDLNVMHRDIKSANVFTNKDGSAKIGDMNVPEVWRDEPYTFVSDVWSLGCVLYEVLTLKPPFQSTDMGGLYKKVLKGHYQKIPMHYSSDLSIILKQMLQVKAENRPNCEQLIQMPIFMKRAKYFYPQFVQNYAMLDQSILLKTIKIPKSLAQSEETSFWNDLSQRLPKANYERDSIGQSEDIYDLASNRSHLNNKQNNESISKINLPQINSLKSIKGKDSSPNLLRRNRNNKNKRSFEINNASLIKNQSMEMYGISENEDDGLEREFGLDGKHLNSQSMLLNEQPTQNNSKSRGILNQSIVETPIMASQFELTKDDDTYQYQREVHKRILLGKPIKHSINSSKNNKQTISLNKPQLQLPPQKKNSSLMYDDYIKSYKIPKSILTPLQDNSILQIQKVNQNLSVNERIQLNKESGSLLPKIKNEKTRNNNEYGDSVIQTNKYRYQSESQNSNPVNSQGQVNLMGLGGSLSNNYKKSVILKNHAYQHQQLQNQQNLSSQSISLSQQQSHSSLGKSSRSILLKNQAGIFIKNESNPHSQNNHNTNNSYRISQLQNNNQNSSSNQNLYQIEKPQIMQQSNLKLNINSNQALDQNMNNNNNNSNISNNNYQSNKKLAMSSQLQHHQQQQQQQQQFEIQLQQQYQSNQGNYQSQNQQSQQILNLDYKSNILYQNIQQSQMNIKLPKSNLTKENNYHSQHKPPSLLLSQQQISKSSYISQLPQQYGTNLQKQQLIYGQANPHHHNSAIGLNLLSMNNGIIGNGGSGITGISGVNLNNNISNLNNGINGTISMPNIQQIMHQY